MKSKNNITLQLKMSFLTDIPRELLHQIITYVNSGGLTQLSELIHLKQLDYFTLILNKYNYLNHKFNSKINYNLLYYAILKNGEHGHIDLIDIYLNPNYNNNEKKNNDDCKKKYHKRDIFLCQIILTFIVMNGIPTDKLHKIMIKKLQLKKGSAFYYDLYNNIEDYIIPYINKELSINSNPKIMIIQNVNIQSILKEYMFVIRRIALMDISINLLF